MVILPGLGHALAELPLHLFLLEIVAVQLLSWIFLDLQKQAKGDIRSEGSHFSREGNLTCYSPS